MQLQNRSSRSVEARKHGAAIARSLEAGARALSAADMRLEQRAQEALAKQRRARDRTLEDVDRLRAKLASLNTQVGAQLNQKRARVGEERRQHAEPLAPTASAASMAALAGVLSVAPNISYENAVSAVERAARASPRRAHSLGLPHPGTQRRLRAAQYEFARDLASVLLEPSHVNVTARESRATFSAVHPHNGASFSSPLRYADGAPSSVASLLTAAPGTKYTGALAIVRPRRDDAAEAEERAFQLTMAVAAQQLDGEEAAMRTAATRAALREERSERPVDRDPTWSSTRPVLPWALRKKSQCELANLRKNDRVLQRVCSRTGVVQSTFRNSAPEQSPARITNVGHRHRDEARDIIASLRRARGVSDDDGRRATSLAAEWRRTDAADVARATATEVRTERRGEAHAPLEPIAPPAPPPSRTKKKRKKKRGLPPPPPPPYDLPTVPT